MNLKNGLSLCTQGPWCHLCVGSLTPLTSHPPLPLTYCLQTMQLKETDVTFALSAMVGPFAMGSNCLFPFAVGAACLLDKGKWMNAAVMFDLVQKF